MKQGKLVKENLKSMYIAIGLLMLIVIIGTSGYMLIEKFSFTDAFHDNYYHFYRWFSRGKTFIGIGSVLLHS